MMTIVGARAAAAPRPKTHSGARKHARARFLLRRNQVSKLTPAGRGLDYLTMAA